jgi:YidC/Oxa1 family membrane protein insertase
MEKRLLLAIGLSLLVLLSWSALAPKTQVPVSTVVTSNSAVKPEPVFQSKENTAASLPLPEESKRPLLQINHKNSEIYFDEERAAINKVIFKLERDETFPLKFGFLTDGSSLKYSRVKSGPDEVIFVAQDGAKRITKSFIFGKSNYAIDLQIKIQNISSSAITFNSSLILGMLDSSRGNEQGRYEDVYVSTLEKTSHISATKEYRGGVTKTLGLRDRYFCLIVEPDKTTPYNGYVKKLSNTESEVGLTGEVITLQPSVQSGHLFRIYMGPQDLKTINLVNPDWTNIINFGTFDFISQILLQTLEFLNRLVHSWGWSIILLSILVYLVLYPLSIKQMRSMKEMQAIQPKVEELRKQFKDNPQKLNKEIMELYKLHKVNPLGGCLPLLLQMPIFFALYQALMRSVALRGAKFLWIKDLSEPDRLFTLPVSLPVLGNEFNILPIIMAIGMFFQQKMTSAASGGAAAEQQKIMLIVMPVMFGFIFYRMPSGLVLYWLVNSVLMLLFQLRMNRAK